MIGLIWRGKVHLVKAKDYYAAREILGVLDNEITPWARGTNIQWTKAFFA